MAVTLLALTLSCGGPSNGNNSILVIGLTSDLNPGDEFDRLAITMKVDGAIVQQSNFDLVANPPDVTFPAELNFTDFPDDAKLELDIEAIDSNGAVARILRHLETRGIADGEKRLLRINLEERCLTNAPPGSGDVDAPTCNETTQTCVTGKCRDAFVHPSEQESYVSGWPDAFSDVCKPTGAGAPEILVGEGQSDYLALEDYAVAQLEAGPQGGHHIWVAARVRNLHRSGSITEVSGVIPALGLTISPLKVIFTMDQDEGGYCKLYGLRFQVDIDGDDVETMLGHELKVVVEINDVSGDQGTAEKWVTLSDNLL